jgi:hypothetical protein
MMSSKSKKKGVKKNKKAATYPLYTKISPPNSAMVIRTRAGTPQMQTVNDTMILSNSEILGAVNIVSNAYATTRFPLAPYQTAFLYGTGSNFQRYRFEMLRIVYIPSVPTTTAGSVYLSFGSDHRDLAPVNSNNQMISSGATTCPVWAGYEGGSALSHTGIINNAIALDFPVQLRAGFQYGVITGGGFTALPRQDMNDYAPGYLDVGTNGSTISGTVGQVYMVYKVKFWMPINSGQQN